MDSLIDASPFSRLVATHVMEVNFTEPKPVLPHRLKGDTRKARRPRRPSYFRLSLLGARFRWLVARVRIRRVAKTLNYE